MEHVELLAMTQCFDVNQQSNRGFPLINLYAVKQDLKTALNKKYSFISKTIDLSDEQDSVNFAEIVAVSPPPNGECFLSFILGID